MARCWLKVAIGYAINTVLASVGFNLRWLMRAVARLPYFLASSEQCRRLVFWHAVQHIRRCQPSSACQTDSNCLEMNFAGPTGYVKVRYRRLKKNTAQLVTLVALSN